MSEALGLGLIALLLAMWAINWARRAANAAERAAVAAEKSALAAERSAMAARRSAETAAAQAPMPAEPGHRPDADPAGQVRTARVDALARDLVDSWARDGSAWPLVALNPDLADDEIGAVILKAFYAMGRTDDEAKQHVVAVLNFRRDHKPQVPPVS